MFRQITQKTVGHKDLGFGRIIYILVFYNISFSWLLPLNGFQFIFLCRVYCVTVKTKNKTFAFRQGELLTADCGEGVVRISSDRDDRMGKKNQNQKKKSVGLQTKLKKIPRPKFNPQIKKSHVEFPSHKNVQKALNDITRRIETLVFNTQKTP